MNWLTAKTRETLLMAEVLSPLALFIAKAHPLLFLDTKCFSQFFFARFLRFLRGSGLALPRPL